MAFKNKEISNPKTGQSIRFIQTSKDTGGVLLEMESCYNKNSVEPVAHYHPFQEEDFHVVEGELTVRIHGEQKILKRGERLRIEKNVVHSMWNSSSFKAVVKWKVVPAMNTEFLLETTMGLAREGKTDDSGKPGIFQAAVMMNAFTNVFRLASPPFVVQRIVFTLLSPISFLLGYRSTYRHYLD